MKDTAKKYELNEIYLRIKKITVSVLVFVSVKLGIAVQCFEGGLGVMKE